MLLYKSIYRKVVKKIRSILEFVISGIIDIDYHKATGEHVWSIRNRAFFMFLIVYILWFFFHIIESGDQIKITGIVELAGWVIGGVLVMAFSALVGQKVSNGKPTVPALDSIKSMLLSRFNIDLDSLTKTKPEVESEDTSTSETSSETSSVPTSKK